MSLPSLTFQVIKIPNTTVPTTWAHIQAGFPAAPPKPLLMSPKWKLTWIVLYPYNFRVWLLEQLIIIILTDPVFNLARSMSSNTISYQACKGFKEMLFFFLPKILGHSYVCFCKQELPKEYCHIFYKSKFQTLRATAMSRNVTNKVGLLVSQHSLNTHCWDLVGLLLQC